MCKIRRAALELTLRKYGLHVKENVTFAIIIQEFHLRNIMRLIEARSSEIIEKWKEYFGEIFFYLFLLSIKLVFYRQIWEWKGSIIGGKDFRLNGFVP